jgi:hypothetical protein
MYIWMAISNIKNNVNALTSNFWQIYVQYYELNKLFIETFFKNKQIAKSKCILGMAIQKACLQL